MLHLNEGGRRHNEPALISIRDGPLENLWGGGGGGRSTKKIFEQGQIK